MTIITLISVDAMKKSMYLLFAIAAMASVACEHTEELAPEAPASSLVQRDFTALVTKTALSGSDVVWQEGDKISVFAGGTANVVGGAEYALKDYDSENPSKATFTGTVADAPSYYAVYPYSATNAYDGNATLTATVPAEQVITSGSFAPGAAVVVSKATENYQFLFQNAVALLKVVLGTGMDGASRIEVSGNNGEAIAGAFTATYGESGFTFADAASGTSTTASLVYEGGNFVGGQSYYIAIRPCTFSKGLTAKAYFGEGNSNIAVKTSSVAVTINAGQILPLGTFNASNWAPTLELGDFETLTLGSGTYLTFDYGQSETFPVNLASEVNTSTLQDDGWTVSYSDGSVTITAPANNGSHAPQPGAIGLTSTKNSSVTTSYGLRLRGIGSVEELEAFAAAQAPASGSTIAGKTIGHADTEACVPFLVNDEALFAADLSIAAANFDNHDHAYALHHNEFPINGNGRTVNLGTYTGSAWPLAFIQDLYYDVHDLTLTGNLSNSANNAIMGSLATRINSEVTVSNVSSSVNITYTGSTSVNAYIGGIVGNVISGNKNATFYNCSYSGNISCSREVIGIGGIVARGEATGTADNIWTTIQNCTFSGSIEYTPNAVNNKQTGIGGLIGISARRLKLINCSTSGSIVANMENMLLSPTSTTVWESVTTNTRGIGGVFGVTYGTHESSPYAGYYLDNVVSSTTVTVNGANASQSNKVFQIRGYNGATIIFPDDGSADSQGRKNILLDPTALNVVYNYYTAPAISAVGTTSFSYGTSQDIAVTTDSLDGWTVSSSAPEGWSVNTKHITDASPYITVTPPSQDDIKAGNAVGMGSITFTLTSETYGSAPASGDGVAVRLYGINSLEELKAFRTEHGVTVNSESNVDKTKLTSWLRDGNKDGELLLNTDIALAKSDLISNAFIMRSCFVPIEGNNRTITFNNITTTATRMSLFQALYYDVRNLNIAGTMSIEKSAETADDDAWIASLSTVLSGNATISNVNSSVAMAVKKGTDASYTRVIAGGIVGKIETVDDVTASGATFTNCNFTGSITMDRSSRWVGGILGALNVLATVTLNNCDCSAIIAANRTAYCLGGIVGSGGSSSNEDTATSSTVILTDCDYTGTISAVYSYTTPNLRLGGILGNCERHAELANCTVSGGSINVDTNGQLFNTNSYRAIGGIIGRRGAQAAKHDMTTLITGCTMAVPIIITNAHASEAETVNGETSASKQGISVVVGNNRAPSNSSLAVGTKGRFYDNTTVTGSVSITKAE